MSGRQLVGVKIGAAFRKREATGRSRLLDGADKMFGAIKRHKGKVFLIWTHDPTLSLLNNPNSRALSKPYKQLLFATSFGAADSSGL